MCVCVVLGRQAAEVDAPAPIGRLLVVNPKPHYEPQMELEREMQVPNHALSTLALIDHSTLNVGIAARQLQVIATTTSS